MTVDEQMMSAAAEPRARGTLLGRSGEGDGGAGGGGCVVLRCVELSCVILDS